MKAPEFDVHHILDRLLEGFQVIGRDWRYLYLNDAVSEHGRAAKKNLLGKTMMEAYPGIENSELFARLQKCMKERVPSEMENEFVYGNGQRRWFELRIFPVEVGIAVLSHDITRRKTAERENKEILDKMQTMFKGTIAVISSMVATRDPFTSGHQQRTSQLAHQIGAELGLGESENEGLRLASTIHDIGKIAIPAEILAKPAALSPREFELVKVHPKVGYDILEPILFPRPVAEIVYEHHEKLDGSGYPRGLSAEAILPQAKILSVADVMEAMVSHRPYRAALGIDMALEEISGRRGQLYDPDVVDACLLLFLKKNFSFIPY